MKIVWLLYQQEDLSANRDYARLMRENGLKRDMKIETVLTRDLTLLMDENGTPSCLRKGRKERPDAVIARMWSRCTAGISSGWACRSLTVPRSAASATISARPCSSFPGCPCPAPRFLRRLRPCLRTAP
ncbi:MAG: hypothetical protein ACLUE8_06070 [Lachnospiraceae bacterium]